MNGVNKDKITIEDLLRHQSGYQSGLSPKKDEAYIDYINRLVKYPLTYVPKENTVYSDINFILLAEIVRKLSHKKLSEFAFENIYSPLEMNHTFFKVPDELKNLCVKTIESNDDCEPHDPTAFQFKTESLGHAGLFSTVEDIAKFSQMYLNQGELNGVRILKNETVKKMITLQTGQIQGLDLTC